MSSIIKFFSDGINKFFGFLLAHFSRQLKDLWQAKSDIPLRYLASDFLSVLSSVGMFAFLNLIAFVVFTFLPQGKDIMLIIAEDISRSHQVGNLVWLLVGTIAWSIASEFGSRFAIYITDNTLQSISDKRIAWRTAVQHAIAEYFLLLPYLIVTLGFVINYLQDTSLNAAERNWGFGIPVLCLYLVFRAVAYFYYDGITLRVRRADRKGLDKLTLLSEGEVKWTQMLFGIYNRFVFTLPRSTKFGPEIAKTYKNFSDYIDKNDQKPLDPTTGATNFPQDPSMMDPDFLVPPPFQLIEFTKGENADPEQHKDESYKWVYQIPLTFYPTLQRQVKLLVYCSLGLFLLISFLPIPAYTHIGAPGLVVIAFACWCGIYVGFLYMDYAVLRKYWISLRFILFILMIIGSWFNDDHPVRYNGDCAIQTRAGIDKHFTKWLDQYRKDTVNTLYNMRADSLNTDPFVPVVFVCAEGGALRTGAFASQTLSFLQDSIQYHCGVDIKKSVYAYSGVSGGSLGISYFNAAAYVTEPNDLRDGKTFSQLSKSFFTQDYLSPVIGKMFYGEIIQLFIPFHISAFDRAIALELAWEAGYEEVIKPAARNIFSANLASIYKDTSKIYPALFINTTEVESGFQCWLTNIDMDSSRYVEAARRDLLDYKVRGGLNYSTMINFSTRFPLFSPAATLIQDKGKKFHYVDGGYVENTGCGTMLEVLKALTPLIKPDSQSNNRIKVKPFVFILRYDLANNGHFRNLNIGNEVSEVIQGMYNTRSGRSTTALIELENYVKSLDGETMVLPLEKSGSEVPMNWVLSSKSMDKIEEDIKYKWNRRDSNALRKFFAIDTNKFVKRGKISELPKKNNK